MNILESTGPRVVITDYGLGNLYSVERALNYIGASTEITGDPHKVLEADRLILPGVGAFGDGMEGLRKNGLVEPITEYAKSQRPLLGICLGMQLLMSEGEEFGLHKGLGIIKGRVVHLKSFAEGAASLKTPHIGWNKLFYAEGLKTRTWRDTILENLKENVFVYFLHSNVAILEDRRLCLAESIYGSAFCSVLRLDNIYGCQFHPERSGEAGLEIYRRFVFGLNSKPGKEVCGKYDA